jgi:hypothetical protein
VGQGEDGAFAPAAYQQRLVLLGQGTAGAADRMGGFAQQPADVGIAFALFSRLAFARRFVIARTHPRPSGEFLGLAEGLHVVADFYQQQGGAQRVESRQGLQGAQEPALRCQSGQQPLAKTGDTPVEILHMIDQLREHKPVRLAEVSIHGIAQFLLGGAQPRAGVAQDLLRGLARRQGLDHGPGGLAVQVADDHTQADTAVGQDLVDAVFLPGQDAGELLQLARNQPQLAEVGRRNEAAREQSGAGQDRQPLGIGDVRLAPRNPLDMPGVHHQGADARLLQCRIRTLPIDPRALHHHHVRLEAGHPRGHCPAITLETAKLPHLGRHRPVGSFRQHAHGDLGLVNIQPDGATVDRCKVHNSPLGATVDTGDDECQHRMSSGARRLGLFTVRSTTSQSGVRRSAGWSR